MKEHGAAGHWLTTVEFLEDVSNDRDTARPSSDGVNTERKR
jgi:hypothetical protein